MADSNPTADATTQASRDHAQEQDLPTVDVSGLPDDLRSIGRYTLLRQLGAGGMGVVYLGYDDVLDRNVAIKLVRPERADLRSPTRILREGRALARLSHPNVVQIYEVSSFRGQMYLVMEYVKGMTLREYCRAERRPGEILARFLEAGRGLAAAHARGLVHRDFKPDNVLIDEDHSARVVDFGLVAEPHTDEASSPHAPLTQAMQNGLTETGAFVGTPAYMSPEQLRREGSDERSDQFSYCVALYEGLCAERPTRDMMGDELQPASLRAQEQLPGWLAAVLQRGLAFDPAERWPSMAALLAALGDDPIAARRRWLRQLGVFVVVSLVVGGLVLGVMVLRRRLETEAHERRAASRLAAVEARIIAARERDDLDAAARAFEEFIADPDMLGTEAYVQAWIHEGDRRREDGALQGASEGYANAYLTAKGPSDRVAALTGVAAVLRQQHRWGALMQAVHTLARIDPAAAKHDPWPAYATEAALRHRDVVRAQTLLSADDPPELRTMVDRLATTATATDLGNVFHISADVDIEGDGTPELLLQRQDVGGLRFEVVRRDASLTRVATYSLAEFEPSPTMIRTLTHDADGRPLLLGTVDTGRGPRAHLLYFGEDLKLRSRQPIAVAWTHTTIRTDLDGDGAPEVYIGTGPFSRNIVQLVQGPDGSFDVRDPVAPGDAPNSNIQGLVSEDLDGDGRDELLVATGPWDAFDVRVYRHERGLLRLVDRDQLGSVGALTTMRRGGEPLLAALHGDDYPSRRIFGADRPTGEPVGVYLYRLADDQLKRVDFLPLGMSPGVTYTTGRTLFSGDLNGDGRQDLGLSYVSARDHFTVLYLQQADGSFVPLHLDHARLEGLTDLDADAVAELLLVLGPNRSRGTLWVVGTGDGPLEAFAGPELAPSSLPFEAPTFAADWARAADLQAMGLPAPAALAFERIAEEAPDPRLTAHANLAAARAREQSGDPRGSAARYEDAGRFQALAEEAGRAALRLHQQLEDHAAARDALDRLLGVPDLSDRAELVALREQLDALARGEERLTLSFDRPLDDAWTIEDPLALEHNPAHGSLHIDTTATGVLATYPLVLTSPHPSLEIDLTIEAQEWESNLRIGLVPEDGGERVIELEFDSGGGAGVVRGLTRCHFNGNAILYTGVREDSMQHERLTLRGSKLGPLGQHSCVIISDQGESARTNNEIPPVPVSTGRYSLVVRHFPEQPARLLAKIHRISIVGARPDAHDPPDELQRFARALVEQDAAVATTLARTLEPTSPRVRLWIADTLLRAGQVQQGREALTALLVASDDDASLLADFHGLVRRDPGLYGTLLRADASDLLLERFHESFQVAVHHHITDPRVVDPLLAALGPASLGTLDPLADDATLERTITLLRWRALAHLQRGHRRTARRDLTQAIDLARPSTQRLGDEPLREALIELAVLAASEENSEEARELLDEAVSSSINKTLTRDLIRARSELASLLP